MRSTHPPHGPLRCHRVELLVRRCAAPSRPAPTNGEGHQRCRARSHDRRWCHRQETQVRARRHCPCARRRIPPSAHRLDGLTELIRPSCERETPVCQHLLRHRRHLSSSWRKMVRYSGLGPRRLPVRFFVNQNDQGWRNDITSVLVTVPMELPRNERKEAEADKRKIPTKPSKKVTLNL